MVFVVFLLLVAGAACGPTMANAERRDPAPPTKRHPGYSLQGDYFAAHDVHVYDATTDEYVLEGKYMDVLSIREAKNSALEVRIRVVGRNFSECYFDDTMMPTGPHQWKWVGADVESRCEVILVQTPAAVVVTSSWDCYEQLCGTGVTLEATFPFSERERHGTYEWSRR